MGGGLHCTVIMVGSVSLQNNWTGASGTVGRNSLTLISRWTGNCVFVWLCSLTWYDIIWYAMLSCGTVFCGNLWYSVQCHVVLYCVVWYGMV